MICAPSIGEEQAASFEIFYYAVRFISKEAKSKEGQFSYLPWKKILKMSDTFILEGNLIKDN